METEADTARAVEKECYHMAREGRPYKAIGARFWGDADECPLCPGVSRRDDPRTWEEWFAMRASCAASRHAKRWHLRWPLRWHQQISRPPDAPRQAVRAALVRAGMSYREIAEVEGVTVRAIRAWVAYHRQFFEE